jgi:polyisoprenoid-binding protein YceI
MKRWMIPMLLLATSTLQAQMLYNVNTTDSKVEWEATKVIGGGHHGTVDISSGHLLVTERAITAGEFVIDMKTIAVLEMGGKAKMLEGHLRSKDFFEVKNFPTCSLLIKKFENNQLTCDLTIKGITNEVVFPVEWQVNGKTLTAKANIQIDRAKYDVRFRSQSFFDNLKDKAISDTISYKVSVVATIASEEK